MNRFLLASCSLLILSVAATTHGADLPASCARALDNAAIPLKPGTVFCIGTPEAGLRLATKEDPEVVRRWYREKLSTWSLIADENLGIWMLYDGPPDLGFAAALAFNHLNVQENPDLPEWHNLPKDMTTEIVILATQEATSDTDGALVVIPPWKGWKTPDVPKSDTAATEGVEGSIHHAQDVESETERYYFYLQDENYNELLIAYEDELADNVAARLEALADDDRQVRILGVLFIDEEMGRSIFDRSGALRIVAAD